MIAARLGREIVRGRFARSVAVLAGGTAIGQLLVVASSPLLTRLYLPSDFGVLSVYVSLLTFLLGISTLRYYMAIPLAPDSESVAALLVLCGLILLGILLLVTLATNFFSGTIAQWTNAPELKPLLWLLPLGLAGAGVVQVLTSWAIRRAEFSTLARIRIGQSASLIGAQVGLSFLTHGPLGLLIGDAIGRAAGGLGLARMAWQDLQPQLRRISPQRIFRVANQYRRFPLISSWTGLVASTGGQGPTLLIAAYYGPTVVGWFGLCQRLLSMSFVLVASAIGTVFLAESSRIAALDLPQLKRLYWATVTRSALIAIVLVTGIFTAAPFLFGPVLGPEWEEAGRYAQFLAISAGFQFVDRAVGSTTTVVQRQDLELFAEIIWTVCAAGSILLGGILQTSALTAVVLFTVGVSFGSIVSITLSWYAVHDAVRRNPH